MEAKFFFFSISTTQEQKLKKVTIAKTRISTRYKPIPLGFLSQSSTD